MNRTDSFHCSICNLDWPHHIWFQRCLQCGEDIGRGIKLPIGYAMTMEEAREYCDENDLKWPQPTMRRLMQPAPKPKPKAHRINPHAAVKKLHEDLDRWADEIPDWMKR